MLLALLPSWSAIQSIVCCADAERERSSAGGERLVRVQAKLQGFARGPCIKASTSPHAIHRQNEEW